jgi:hypothetical protein
MPPAQPALHNFFGLQNEMGSYVTEKALNSIHQQHAQALAISNRKGFGTLAAEPEMLYGMPMGGLLILLRVLLKAKQAAMPAIEIGLAVRMGAFEIHGH